MMISSDEMLQDCPRNYIEIGHDYWILHRFQHCEHCVHCITLQLKQSYGTKIVLNTKATYWLK
jgi:hypothetical protein